MLRKNPLQCGELLGHRIDDRRAQAVFDPRRAGGDRGLLGLGPRQSLGRQVGATEQRNERRPRPLDGVLVRVIDDTPLVSKGFE